MKIKEGFLLRQVAGQSVVMPMDDELNMNMMITLNETGGFLWEKLQAETTEEALVQALLSEYDVSEERAKASVESFVDQLRNNGFLA